MTRPFASVAQWCTRAAARVRLWLDVLTDRMRGAGIARQRARELAVELFCAIEGAFLLSRATRSPEPIRIAGRAMTESVRQARDKAFARGSTRRTS